MLLPRAIAPPPGGSRFGACPATLATFASKLVPPNTHENKRLPSGRWEQMRLLNVPTLPSYEDTSPDAKLIASANMTVLNRNESNAWTNDRRRIRFEVIATSDT